MAVHNKLIIANWKMNTTLADAVVLGKSIQKGVEGIGNVKVVIAPPSVWLYPLKEEFVGYHPQVELAVQNIHYEEEGAFTGEISAMMVKKIADYALIGHSERRQFGEDKEQIREKIKRALEWDLKPVIFLGQDKRASNFSSLVELLKFYLSGVKRKDYFKLAVVYEPIWAISSNKNSQPVTGYELEAAVSKFRAYLGEEPKILYGGSVTPQNAARYLHIHGLNGLVVGSASLKAKDFIKICSLASEVREA